MRHLVSILIPAYNAERWIGDTIRSALSQTWPRTEIIIVDDESSDNTLHIAKQFESRSVKVLTQPHEGASAARNRALSLAQGEYIQWLDADDLLAPDKISKQLQLTDGGRDFMTLLSSGYGSFYFRHEKAKVQPTSLWQDLSPIDWLMTKFMKNAWMVPAVFLVSRQLCASAGPWNTNLSLDDDGEYFARVVASSERVKFIKEAKSYYRVGNFSSLSERVSEEAYRSLLTSKMLSIRALLSLEDSDRTRLGCLRYLQTSFGKYYPEMELLVDEARGLARSLGGELELPQLSWKYSWIKVLFGWKMAKVSQRAIQRIKVSSLKMSDMLLYKLENGFNGEPLYTSERKEKVMSTSEIPFLDLVTVHRELREELRSVFDTALDTAGFVGGPAVQEFERDFAAFCESQFCVGMASGTDALRLALVAAGVRPGDTVVTVPLTFIATTEAISQAGARPDFVDIDERTYTMDPEKLRAYLETECTPDVDTGRAVSKRTGGPVTAIIPVHLYGQMADMDPILELAARYDLIVIEDACQAHGAEYRSNKEDRWRKAGSMGRASAFSFYPSKNLGACGEAGAITTDDEQLARRCQMLADHGQSRRYRHDIEGYNGRLDAIQAGVLRVKLRHLANWNEQRRERARGYDELLADAEEMVILPHVPSWSRPVYHLYVVRVADREALQKDLAAAGIGTGIHYPIPLHLAKAYEAVGFRRGDFPVAELVASQVLSLPMFPGLSLEQQERVVTCVVESTKATGQQIQVPEATGQYRP